MDIMRTPGGEKEMGRAMRKARSRIHAWKEAVQECESAKSAAVGMLEDYADRMASMVARGEIGTRKGSDGQDYPQLRIVYWGEIESGTMALVCMEIDYGAGERARVGLWARPRAVFDGSALNFAERARAWWRAGNLGKASQVEAVWMEVRACLRALSMDLELDLTYKGFAGIEEFGFQSSQGQEWGRWEGGEGGTLLALGAPQSTPSDAEWMELESKARDLLDRLRRDANEEPPKRPSPRDGLE